MTLETGFGCPVQLCSTSFKTMRAMKVVVPGGEKMLDGSNVIAMAAPAAMLRAGRRNDGSNTRHGWMRNGNEMVGLSMAYIDSHFAVAIHDLGIYEAMWWVVILAIFWGAMGSTWELTRRHPGFHIYLLPLVYAPARFGLDFLRIADARYLGLTPAQWISLGFFAWGAAMMWRWNQRRLAAG